MEQCFTASGKRVIPLQQAKPHSPIALSHDVPQFSRITFVDISHSFQTINIHSKENQFSSLIISANEWLSKNSIWELFSCETVPLVFKDESSDPSDHSATKRLLYAYTEYELGEFKLYKGLRLWIIRRDDGPEVENQTDSTVKPLKYMTFKSKLIKMNDDGRYEWEKLDNIVETINDLIKKREINGRIINIECVTCDADDNWHYDDESPQIIMETLHHVMVVRLYYIEDDDPCEDEIEFFDFIPQHMSNGTILSKPTFESIDSLQKRITNYLIENPHLKVFGAQIIDFKLQVTEILTRVMLRINDNGNYIRVIRIVCFKQSQEKDTHSLTSQQLSTQSSARSSVPSSAPLLLPSKSKRSIQFTSQCFDVMEHSTVHGPFHRVKREIEQYMDRDEWEWNEHENKKWKFLCVSTFTIYAKDNSDAKRKKESTVYSNRPNLLTDPRLYHFIRLFYDSGINLENQSNDLIRPQSDRQSISYNGRERTNINKSVSCMIM